MERYKPIIKPLENEIVWNSSIKGCESIYWNVKHKFKQYWKTNYTKSLQELHWFDYYSSLNNWSSVRKLDCLEACWSKKFTN